MEKELINFESRSIRKVWHNDEWFFSVVDVIALLTDSPIPKTYWSKLKTKISAESESYPIWVQLKIPSADGKKYQTDAANTEGVIRICMSVPSPKAEPFRQWISSVAKERIDETENPELMTQRQIALYKAKGYSDEWIEKRMQSIETRKQLTDEWKARGVIEGKEYSTLTAIIARGTFGLSPTEHKDVKGLTKSSQNLRDHMTPLELIFTQLGEELTRQEAIKEDAQGFRENKDAAAKGGITAGEALKLIEVRTGQKVISKDNYLNQENQQNKNELPPSE